MSRQILCEACQSVFVTTDDPMVAARDHELDTHRDREFGSITYRDVAALPLPPDPCN